MCRILTWSFGLLYIITLILLLIGTFGLLGSEPDPLAGVYLMPIGLPWIMLVDLTPEPLWPWLAAMAPGVNLALLWILCSRLKSRRHR